jgi:hypothetical protein
MQKREAEGNRWELCSHHSALIRQDWQRQPGLLYDRDHMELDLGFG